MGDHAVPIYVFTRDGVREVRGGGHIDGICGDIHRDVGPGEEFAGMGYDELADGTYALNLETGLLSRMSAPT